MESVVESNHAPLSMKLDWIDGIPEDESKRVERAITFIIKDLIPDKSMNEQEKEAFIFTHLLPKFRISEHTLASKKIINKYKKLIADETGVTPESKSDSDYKPLFNEVAERVLVRQPTITFDDTKEFCIYRNGVYTYKGAETTLKTLAIEEYQAMMIENKCPAVVPGSRYVSEVLEYIRIYTHVFRDEIDNNEQHKYVINMENGLYNFNTGELTPHNPKFISLRQIPIKYDPKATCPHFIKFMSEVVNPEDAQVLLEYIGYTLVQDMRFEKSVMLQGDGSNGKSILIKFIIAIHGENNVCTTSLQRLCEDKFAMAELHNKLLNVFPDMSGKLITEDESFKGLTTGDLLTAQRKFGQPFQFRNQARQMYSVNTVPPVSDKSYAYFRRWILINFPFTFTENPDPNNKNEKKKDKDFASKLITKEELSGAFNLVISCLKHMYSNGDFSYSKSVEEVEEDYIIYSDPIKWFMEKYVESSKDSIYDHILYGEYCRCSSIVKAKTATKTSFTRRLNKMGYESFRPRNEDGSQVKHWNVEIKETFYEDYPTGDNKEYNTVSNIENNTGIQTEINDYEKKKCIQYWQTINSQN